MSGEKANDYAALENASRFRLSHSHDGNRLSASHVVSNPDVVA